MSLAKIEDAIAEIKAGRMVIVVDDEDRENEGDIIVAAEKLTADHIGFMVRYCSGIICVPMEGDRLEELHLPLMISQNSDAMGTAFTVSVDARANTTTGISAGDRAETIRVLIDPGSTAQDLARPGHIFPLRSVEGGVLRRAGHTEASVDLARLAGCYPAGVVCEVGAGSGLNFARYPTAVTLVVVVVDHEDLAAPVDLPGERFLQVRHRRAADGDTGVSPRVEPFVAFPAPPHVGDAESRRITCGDRAPPASAGVLHRRGAAPGAQLK